MKIVVVCEGATEAALRSSLADFLSTRTPIQRRVGIKLISLKGSVFREKLGTLVGRYTSETNIAGVVALTNVYPNFANSEAAKASLMKCATGRDAHKFRAHAAQFELEAWLIPFWEQIAVSLRVNLKSPGPRPEEINGQRPPSRHLKDLYRKAKSSYEKPIVAAKWLTAERLETAAGHCPELKSFLNSLLEFAGAGPLT